jgi:thiol-disulfide isomerase/thioredoxin
MAAIALAALSVGARSPESERAGAPRPWLDGLEWVNSRPLTRADLAGKVVVVEFWTFDCINCRRTVPAMNRLERMFRDRSDVAIVGIHTPELEHERDAGNVRRAVEGLGLRLPVGRDNAFRAWRAFGNHYWPALYVLDRNDRVRSTHVGELHEGTPAWAELLRTIDRLRRERG